MKGVHTIANNNNILYYDIMNSAASKYFFKLIKI